MNDELEDELGSQKLLVKNHCSTNQHADGFRDPRQDVGQQKQQMCLEKPHLQIRNKRYQSWVRPSYIWKSGS